MDAATTEESPELLDADRFAASINGFEQIAVRQVFREKLDDLAKDGTMFLRAMLFVDYKRTGMNDADSFRAAMLLPLEAVTDRFNQTGDPDEQDEDAIAERDKAYANFVIGTGLSFTVDEYMNLTLGQREALISEANKRG